MTLQAPCARCAVSPTRPSLSSFDAVTKATLQVTWSDDETGHGAQRADRADDDRPVERGDARPVRPRRGGDPGVRRRRGDHRGVGRRRRRRPARSDPRTAASTRSVTGFGQNFAGGKIFFTPATGAHIMTGAILEKYESLGGPADSDLGFPTIDEGAGRAPDSRNTTFSAADKPVIFWTPDTGARVVRGPINAAWDKLGGSRDRSACRPRTRRTAATSSRRSSPAARCPTTRRPRSSPRCRPIWPGSCRASRSRTTRRRPSTRRGAPPGERWARSAPHRVRRITIGRDGLGQNFAGGKIFYSPETGANVVTGQVLAKYESVGGPEGDLGFPTSNEVDGGLATEQPDEQLRRQGQAGHLLDARLRRGHRARRDERRHGRSSAAPTGALGAPMADQTENGDVITQRFSGGVISWDSDEEHLHHRAGQPRVPAVRPAGAGTRTAQGAGDRRPRIPTAQVVPLDLVVAAGDRSRAGALGLVAFASLRNRRRGAADDDRLRPSIRVRTSARRRATARLTPTIEHADDHSASSSAIVMRARLGIAAPGVSEPRR